MGSLNAGHFGKQKILYIIDKFVHIFEGLCLIKKKKKLPQQGVEIVFMEKPNF